jgi:hypothetical protein
MTGAKIFKLNFEGALSSPQQGTLWPTAHLEADCRSPQPGAGGIHAFHNLRQAVAAEHDAWQSRDVPPDDWLRAYAILRAEGAVVVGEHGWVAKAATIVRIFLPLKNYAAQARALYDRYRVPVELLPRSLAQPAVPGVPSAVRWATAVLKRFGGHGERAPLPVPGRTPAGQGWLRLMLPGGSIQRTSKGRLQIAKGPIAGYDPRARVPALYDAAFAAHIGSVEALRQAREERARRERWAREARERREREAACQREKEADQLRALEILRPYLPIKTVRVSSAQARGRAKQWSYWGVARYQLRETADARAVSNAVVSGASSDRRSRTLAQRDAEAVGRREGRVYCSHIGKLSAALAREILEELECLHLASKTTAR